MNNKTNSPWAELNGNPTLGDVHSALADGARRNRRRKTVTSSLLAVTGVIAAVAAANTFWIADDGSSPSHDTVANPPAGAPSQIEVSSAINEWAPDKQVFGTPAKPGTVIAEECAESNDCSISLMSPGGQSLDLRDVSPDLDSYLATVGLSSASLSYDGRWLSIMDDGGDARLYPLQAGTQSPVVLTADAEGDSWQLVAWGEGSLNAVFAEYDAAHLPVQYAVVDLMSGSSTSVKAPKPTELGPVGTMGIGPLVASRSTSPDKPVTSYTTTVVPVVASEGLEPGTVVQMSDGSVDLSDQLGPRETLAGPDGFVEVRTPPGGESDEVWPRLTVFSSEGGSLVRVGAIEVGYDSAIRMPLPKLPDGASFAGIVDTHSAVVAFTQGNTEHVEAINLDGTIAWSHEGTNVHTWLIAGLSEAVNTSGADQQ